jgi:regulator of protease activity HflC (stomatin/prohibitin superfamily)
VKEQSEAERRERAELRAARKQAREQKRQLHAEEQARQIAKNAYDNIWKQYAEDMKKGKMFASRNLLANLTLFASELVPIMMTAKEHTTLIMELSEKISGDESGKGGESPTELMGKWIRGDVDLSRIPLEEAAQ